MIHFEFVGGCRYFRLRHAPERHWHGIALLGNLPGLTVHRMFKPWWRYQWAAAAIKGGSLCGELSAFVAILIIIWREYRGLLRLFVLYGHHRLVVFDAIPLIRLIDVLQLLRQFLLSRLGLYTSGHLRADRSGFVIVATTADFNLSVQRRQIL